MTMRPNPADLTSGLRHRYSPCTQPPLPSLLSSLLFSDPAPPPLPFSFLSFSFSLAKSPPHALSPPPGGTSLHVCSADPPPRPWPALPCGFPAHPPWLPSTLKRLKRFIPVERRPLPPLSGYPLLLHVRHSFVLAFTLVWVALPLLHIHSVQFKFIIHLRKLNQEVKSVIAKEDSVAHFTVPDQGTWGCWVSPCCSDGLVKTEAGTLDWEPDHLRCNPSPSTTVVRAGQMVQSSCPHDSDSNALSGLHTGSAPAVPFKAQPQALPAGLTVSQV